MLKLKNFIARNYWIADLGNICLPSDRQLQEYESWHLDGRVLDEFGSMCKPCHLCEWQFVAPALECSGIERLAKVKGVENDQLRPLRGKQTPREPPSRSQKRRPTSQLDACMLYSEEKEEQINKITFHWKALGASEPSAFYSYGAQIQRTTTTKIERTENVEAKFSLNNSFFLLLLHRRVRFTLWLCVSLYRVCHCGKNKKIKKKRASERREKKKLEQKKKKTWSLMWFREVLSVKSTFICDNGRLRAANRMKKEIFSSVKEAHFTVELDKVREYRSIAMWGNWRKEKREKKRKEDFRGKMCCCCTFYPSNATQLTHSRKSLWHGVEFMLAARIVSHAALLNNLG